MLSVLIAWCALAAVSIAAGAALITLTGWPAQLTRAEDRFFAMAWVGLLAFGSLSLAVAVVMPLRPWLLAIPLLALAARPVRRIARECRPNSRVALAALLIAIAISRMSSGSGTLYDTGLYHSQLTSWMTQYGLPQGLGLLHFRFAFSSTWFALTALFDQGPLAGRMANTVTGFAIVLLLAQFAVSLERAGKREAIRGDWYLIAALPVLLAFAAAQVFIQSASPNFGAAAAMAVTGWLLLDGTSSLALVMGAGTAAVKLSAVPAMLAAAGRTRVVALVAAACLAAPLFVANYRTSGCPAFPAAVLCADSPTSFTAERTRQMVAETMNYGRNMTNPYGSLAEFTAWITNWADDLLNPYALSLGAVALVVVVFSRVWNRALALALGSAAYYFATAPDLRFGFGSLAILCGCAGMAVLPKHRYPRIGAVAWGAMAAAFILASGVVWDARRVDRDRATRPAAEGRWLMPEPAYLLGADAHHYGHNGIEVTAPIEGDRCGALEIPCTPYRLDPSVGLCDESKGFSGGFCRR